MPRPACAPPVLSAPLFLESVYAKKISEILSEFQTVWICLARPGPALSADKNDRDDAPHPSRDGNPWNCTLAAHVDQLGGSGLLTIALFLFKDPPTVKVI